MSTDAHRFDIRVYYEDTDHGGVVYYANYLKFMERGRSELLRSHGLELDHLEAEFGVMFAVTEANIRYHSPARFNELLSVESRITAMRGARISFSQRISRKSDAALLTSGEIHLACIRRDGSVTRIPKAVLAALQESMCEEELS